MVSEITVSMKSVHIKTILSAFAIFSGIQAQALEKNLYGTFSAGSTGIGIGVETKINDWLGVRGGFDFMPHFTKTLQFSMTTGNDFNDPQAQEEKFNNMKSELAEYTGISIDRKVDMKAEPSFRNFNITVDFHPLAEHRNWRISAGLYWSFSKTIGTTANAIYDSPALVCANIFNNLYDRAMYSYFNDTEFIFGIGATDDIFDKFYGWGKMGMFIGDSIDGGGAYFMVPDGNCTVSARMTTNKIKPYLGIGYEGPVIKGDDRYRVSFDLGALFWGGSPKVITHEGVDIAHDLRNLNGQIQKYIDISNRLTVYPVIRIGISRRLF